MSTFSGGRGLLRVVVLSGTAAFLATSCKDSNDVTGPNPSPTANLAGAWSGQFTPVGPAFYTEPVPALASFQQTGATFDGTITISGSPTVTLQATISGSHVNGTMTDSTGSGTLVGTFEANQLKITIHPHDPNGAGTVGLHR